MKNERAAQVREEQRQQAEAEFRATHTFKPNLTQRSRAAAALALDRAAAQGGGGTGGRQSGVIPTAKLRLADQASLGWLMRCRRPAGAGCRGPWLPAWRLVGDRPNVWLIWHVPLFAGAALALVWCCASVGVVLCWPWCGLLDREGPAVGAGKGAVPTANLRLASQASTGLDVGQASGVKQRAGTLYGWLRCLAASAPQCCCCAGLTWAAAHGEVRRVQVQSQVALERPGRHWAPR